MTPGSSGWSRRSISPTTIRRSQSTRATAGVSHLKRWGCFSAVAALLVGAILLLLEYFPWFSVGSLSVGYVFILFVQIISALSDQKWVVLAAISVALVTWRAGCRWQYLLIVTTLANWTAMHLLNYVSHVAVWSIEVFKVCWIALLLLALTAPFFRKWHDLAISCLALFFTLETFLLISLVPEPVVLPSRWLQEIGFGIYASHLIRSKPPGEFLSGCKLVDYAEEDGTRRQVGVCNKDLRSTVWFRLLVIYDPSRQIARPAIQRTLPWRLAVLRLPDGRSFVHGDGATHLDGSFYWLLDSSPDPGDDGKVRLD